MEALEILEEGDTASSDTVANSAAVNNKRQRSAVWDYFRKVADTAKITGTSKCSICCENVKHGSNTSNLFKVLTGLLAIDRRDSKLYNFNFIPEILKIYFNSYIREVISLLFVMFFSI